MTRWLRTALQSLAALALLALAPGLRAQDLQPVPALSARVIDQTATLAADARQALDARLAAFEAAAGPQMVVLLVPTTAPEDIASFAQRLGDAWQIGRRDVGDGLIIVVAKNDRKVWIAPAKALEGAVPDLAARQIIQNLITPAFKQGDFAGGLTAGVDALIARIQGEPLPAPERRGGQGQGAGANFDWQSLAMVFFVAVPVLGSVLSAVLGRKLGSTLTAGGTGAVAWWLSASLALAAGAGLLALLLVGVMGAGGMGRSGRSGRLGSGGTPIIWGGGGGGGGGFSGDGGGFSSGGGGDFGGGGAGGSW